MVRMITPWIAALTAAVLVRVLNAPAIHAQSSSAAPVQRAFDVVSIKPNHSGVPWSSGSPILRRIRISDRRRTSLARRRSIRYRSRSRGAAYSGAVNPNAASAAGGSVPVAGTLRIARDLSIRARCAKDRPPVRTASCESRRPGLLRQSPGRAWLPGNCLWAAEPGNGAYRLCAACRDFIEDGWSGCD